MATNSYTINDNDECKGEINEQVVHGYFDKILDFPGDMNLKKTVTQTQIWKFYVEIKLKGHNQNHDLFHGKFILST